MTKNRALANSLGAPLGAMLVLMLMICASTTQAQTGDAAPGAGAESLSNWQYYQEVRLPAETSAPWVDFLVSLSVFDRARYDLGDLRLYTPDGREVPYQAANQRD